jgi:hypothetical protein
MGLPALLAAQLSQPAVSAAAKAQQPHAMRQAPLVLLVLLLLLLGQSALLEACTEAGATH